MSIITPSSPIERAPSRPPMARLTGVELRKQIDTRSGFWLLTATALMTVAMTLISVLAFDDIETADDMLEIVLFPTTLLVPVVGILGITSEFTQRTALQTFTWVPQRGRVLFAKMLAMILLGIAAFVVCIICAMLGAALVGGEIVPSGAAFAQGGLYAVISTLMGFAFGMLFGSSAVAIVFYFVAPMVVVMITNVWSALKGVRDWLSPDNAQAPLGSFQMEGADWTNLGLNVLIWVVLPGIIGWILINRREVS